MKAVRVQMRSQAEKGRVFRELHARPGILILPNPWDAGTAKLLPESGTPHAPVPGLPGPADRGPDLRPPEW